MTRVVAGVVPRLVLGLSLAGALVACGSGSGSAGGSGSSPGKIRAGGSPSPDSMAPQLLPPDTNVQPLPTSSPAAAAGRQLLSLPWTFNGLRDNGSLLSLTIEYGGCTTLGGVVTRQDTRDILVTVWASTPTARHEPCPAIERVVHGSVRLDPALGNRVLVHGGVSTGAGTPVS